MEPQRSGTRAGRGSRYRTSREAKGRWGRLPILGSDLSRVKGSEDTVETVGAVVLGTRCAPPKVLRAGGTWMEVPVGGA